MGIVLAREECRVRPKPGREGGGKRERERKTDMKSDGERKEEGMEGGILRGMQPTSDHVCWLD